MRLETLAVHAGYGPDPTARAVTVPIYQTTFCALDDIQHGADLFDLKVLDNICIQIMNPTNDVPEQHVAVLENGVGALAVASGMAAITYVVQTVAEANDNIVSAAKLYGDTYSLLAHALPHIGTQARFAAHNGAAASEAPVDERTKTMFCETAGNPASNIINLQALADAAHRRGVPLIVDNTVATPVLCRPFEHSADIVVYSLAKYMGDHGINIGGVAVDSDKFNWAADKSRFPLLSTSDPSYHGVIYTETFGPAAFIGHRRVIPLRSMGAALPPFNASLILQGLETLALRTERRYDNALAVARYLQQHSQAAWVKYVGLADSPEYTLIRRCPEDRPAAILSFGVQGGNAAGVRFIDALKLAVRLVNIGDVKPLTCHPASTICRQLNAEKLVHTRVSDGMVRLLIDIEHIDDILVGLDQALAVVVRQADR